MSNRYLCFDLLNSLIKLVLVLLILFKKEKTRELYSLSRKFEYNFQGLEAMNRAVDGDTVAVLLLDKAEWTAPLEVVLEDDGFDQGDTLDK